MAEQIALVLEDDIEMARVLELALAEVGIAAWICPTAERSLEMLLYQDLRPAIVLSDVWLPGLDGVALTDTLKSDPRYCHIPVVLISAVTEPPNHRADAFIAKPFDVDELTALLTRLLQTGTPA